MTTYLQTTSDLVHDVLYRSTDATASGTDSDSQDYDAVLVWINRAYRAICTYRQDWWWLRKSTPGTLTFLPAITTGTVLVTNNSTALTFSVAPSATSVAGWFFRATNTNDIFRIATHTGGSTSAVLDSVYTGSTAATSTFLMKLEYALASDVVRVIDPLTTTRVGVTSRVWGEMRCISTQEMNEMFPIHFIETGVPDYYSYVGETTIRINRYPTGTDMLRAEYNYHYRPADLTNAANEVPVLPLERRAIIADLALAMLLDMKGDERADKWLQLAQANMAAFSAEYDYRTMRQSPDLMRIFPRLNQNPYGTVVRSPSGLRYGW